VGGRSTIRLAAVAISLGISPSLAIAGSDAEEPLCEVKGTVVDEMGALIPHAEVVFKGESGTTVSHTGTDGAVNVTLRTGRYAVWVSQAGFITTKLVDFNIAGLTPSVFHIVLRVDNRPSDGAGWEPGVSEVPTATSELPNNINDKPSAAPDTKPTMRKGRSLRCLYLWRCSAS
jgi:hypothetical protein